MSREKFAGQSFATEIQKRSFYSSSVRQGVWIFHLLLCFAAVSGAWRCQAQGTVYFSRADFEAVVTGGGMIDFETVQPSSVDSIGAGTVRAGFFTITSDGGRLFVTNPTNGLYPIAGTGQYVWNYDSNDPIELKGFSGTAFGADFSGGIQPNSSYDATLTAKLINGETYSYGFTGTRDQWTFLGVAFSQPIASIIYSDGGRSNIGTHEEMIDNIR